MGAMTDPETQPVTIAWRNPFKAPTVQLGENLITDAARVTVDCVSGGPPKIFLEFVDKAVEDLQFPGVVHVVREVAAEPIELVVGFLEDLDPAELERVSLEKMEMGGPQTFGEAALLVLKEWARGD
jgi:hypothetical protein